MANIPGRGASGFKGVTRHKKHGGYMARIKVNYKQVHLGYFKTPEEAHAAYVAAAEKAWGEFASR